MIPKGHYNSLAEKTHTTSLLKKDKDNQTNNSTKTQRRRLKNEQREYHLNFRGDRGRIESCSTCCPLRFETDYVQPTMAEYTFCFKDKCTNIWSMSGAQCYFFVDMNIFLMTWWHFVLLSLQCDATVHANIHCMIHSIWTIHIHIRVTLILPNYKFECLLIN